MVSAEIRQNGTDLSVNKYKKIEYTPLEYPPVAIMQDIRGLYLQIGRCSDTAGGATMKLNVNCYHNDGTVPDSIYNIVRRKLFLFQRRNADFGKAHIKCKSLVFIPKKYVKTIF